MKISSVLALISILILSACRNDTFGPEVANNMNSPYLQAVSDSSIIVMYESYDSADVMVDYGLSEKSVKRVKTSFFKETTSKPVTYVHRIKLRNLKPDTSYVYKVFQHNDTTKAQRFRTAVSRRKPFRIAVMGDCESNPQVHSMISERLRSYDPHFSLYLGDLCSDSKYVSWKFQFLTQKELNLSSQVPFFNAVGNREGWSQNTQAFTQAPESKSSRNDYYSFNYGDAHILVLSTEHSCEMNSDQYEFAKYDLLRNRKKWKIAAFHKPAFSHGSYKGDDMMQDVTRRLFERFGVDLVLTGHSHFYQHNFINGIHHLVMGGAGGELSMPDDSENTIMSSKTYHFGIADVSRYGIKFRVYDLNNILIDSLEIKN